MCTPNKHKARGFYYRQVLHTMCTCLEYFRVYTSITSTHTTYTERRRCLVTEPKLTGINFVITDEYEKSSLGINNQTHNCNNCDQVRTEQLQRNVLTQIRRHIKKTKNTSAFDTWSSSGVTLWSCSVLSASPAVVHSFL